MEQTCRILAINPGSTSTKIAVFDRDKQTAFLNISHRADELDKYPSLEEQRTFRMEEIVKGMKTMGIAMDSVDCFVGRGGAQETMEGGTYEVTPGSLLYKHGRMGYTAKHPASLGAVLACDLAYSMGKRAFTVNPPSVDEIIEEARFCGIKGIRRTSSTHALNQKETAKQYAKSVGKDYASLNLIVAHIGGGISVTAHRHGRMIDTNDCLGNSGPMAPTRCGDMPVSAIIRLCFSGKYTEKQMMDFVSKNGGIVSHLGTSDMRKVREMIQSGDEYAEAVYNAMIYQIEKSIGSMFAALHGDVDAILLTGGMAYDDVLTEKIKSDLLKLAEVYVLPGEFEMEGLVNGVLAIFDGKETLKEYTGKSKFRSDWFQR